MSWEYKKDADMPQGKAYLVRRNGGITEDWNSTRKTWQKNNDVIGIFLGLETGYQSISEKEAADTIKYYMD